MEFMRFICCVLLCAISSVSSFSWETCGDPTDPIKVVSLTSYSNSKILYFTGRGKVGVNLTAPIEAKLDVKKRILWNWVSIPCVDQVGSCTYDDVCSLSPYINKSCPQEFTSNDLPCKCPILQGQYAAKRFPIELRLLPHWIESGTYKIQITISKNGEELLCILLNLKL